MKVEIIEGSCDCISQINDALDDVYLETMISFGSKNPQSQSYTRLIRKDNNKPENRKNRPSLMKHIFCPFCGKELLS